MQPAASIGPQRIGWVKPLPLVGVHKDGQRHAALPRSGLGRGLYLSNVSPNPTDTINPLPCRFSIDSVSP